MIKRLICELSLLCCVLCANAVSPDSMVTVSGKAGEHNYVDLGLKSGRLWATCNVGATNPTEYGDYFAWGETATKNVYDWKTYAWSKSKYNNLTKYCVEKSYGKVDSLKVLYPADDAATYNWGGDWRMPTKEEVKELVEGCIWVPTDDFNGTGVAGRIGTSRANGNIIFLPAGGFYEGKKLYDEGKSSGFWSSSLREYGSNGAYLLNFHKDYIDCYGDSRFYGQNVRAVVR